MPLELNKEQYVASAGWWGDFMPIDQWIPLRIRPQFKGLEFRNSHFGDLTPDAYEHCFASMKEFIQELADDDEGLGGVILGDENVPAYDLRWGVTTAAEQPMQQDITPVSSNKDDEPIYNLGWGVNSVGGVKTEVIKSRCPSPLSPLPESSASMDLDHDNRDSSPEDEDIHYGSEAKDVILQENQWLKVIGNDMTDQHIYAIVKNAVHELNHSCALAQILMENRHILGSFTEA
ncbi:hypothetical protein DFH29DRAFT_878012 [Suillus ampliporus]|nr:hypothetical protein DFH29DRAFT_878012 [Suillus ampliporus]